MKASCERIRRSAGIEADSQHDADFSSITGREEGLVPTVCLNEVRSAETSPSSRPAIDSRLAVTAVFVFASLLFPFAFAIAHEPITTRVRFNKEVVRVLQRSCLGCHRTGGIAMSLATYEEARPWAKAIKEELLEKRMPPWHAVRGYGEFRNAPPITQREIDLIVNWVEGGAPRGDEKDLPPGPLFSDGWS
jgi:hypothetical protein